MANAEQAQDILEVIDKTNITSDDIRRTLQEKYPTLNFSKLDASLTNMHHLEAFSGPKQPSFQQQFQGTQLTQVPSEHGLQALTPNLKALYKARPYLTHWNVHFTPSKLGVAATATLRLIDPNQKTEAIQQLFHYGLAITPTAPQEAIANALGKIRNKLLPMPQADHTHWPALLWQGKLKNTWRQRLAHWFNHSLLASTLRYIREHPDSAAMLFFSLATPILFFALPNPLSTQAITWLMQAWQTSHLSAIIFLITFTAIVLSSFLLILSKCLKQEKAEEKGKKILQANPHLGNPWGTNPIARLTKVLDKFTTSYSDYGRKHPTATLMYASVYAITFLALLNPTAIPFLTPFVMTFAHGMMSFGTHPSHGTLIIAAIFTAFTLSNLFIVLHDMITRRQNSTLIRSIKKMIQKPFATLVVIGLLTCYGIAFAGIHVFQHLGNWLVPNIMTILIKPFALIADTLMGLNQSALASIIACTLGMMILITTGKGIYFFYKNPSAIDQKYNPNPSWPWPKQFWHRLKTASKDLWLILCQGALKVLLFPINNILIPFIKLTLMGINRLIRNVVVDIPYTLHRWLMPHKQPSRLLLINQSFLRVDRMLDRGEHHYRQFKKKLHLWVQKIKPIDVAILVMFSWSLAHTLSTFVPTFTAFTYLNPLANFHHISPLFMQSKMIMISWMLFATFLSHRILSTVLHSPSSHTILPLLSTLTLAITLMALPPHMSTLALTLTLSILMPIATSALGILIARPSKMPSIHSPQRKPLPPFRDDKNIHHKAGAPSHSLAPHTQYQPT